MKTMLTFAATAAIVLAVATPTSVTADPPILPLPPGETYWYMDEGHTIPTGHQIRTCDGHVMTYGNIGVYEVFVPYSC